MRNRFVIIDESGVIGGVSQPRFVLGALNIADTATLTHGLTPVRSRVCGRHGTAVPQFELRFSAITERTARAHAEAVTLLRAEPEWELRVVFFEKELERLGREPAFAAEIFGAVTLESHASLLIQIVDTVVGAVRHVEARRRGYPQRTGTPKAAVADEALALLTRTGDEQGNGGNSNRSFVVRTATEDEVHRKQ